MQDSELTQLFKRMDDHMTQQDSHLAQQDVSLQMIITTLAQQNAVLAQMAQMLAETRREMEVSSREARAFWAGRGRDAGYPAPPAQIPACGTTAPGSGLGS